MTTIEIQNLIGKQQVMRAHNPVVSNITFFSFESDVLSVSGAGYVYEFEVKISKADFKKDSEKDRKHNLFKMGVGNTPNYFYYVCPQGLIKASQVPLYAGLMYVEGDKLVEVIKAPIIHNEKHDLLKLMTKVCRVQSERLYLGSCKLTVKNNQIKTRNVDILREAGFSDNEIKTFVKRNSKKS